MNPFQRKFAMSNRRRSFFFVLCIIVVILLSILDKSRFKYKWSFRPEYQATKGTSDFEQYHSSNFTITNVVDGDTLDIDYPDGEKKYTRIRLIGIDSPELYTDSGAMYFASEAREFARKSALGKNVTIYLDEGNDSRDKYGRLLAYVSLPDGNYLNEILINEGYAYAYTIFRHSFYNKYNQLESRARSSNKGLWQNITPNQMPSWMQERELN